MVNASPVAVAFCDIDHARRFARLYGGGGIVEVDEDGNRIANDASRPWDDRPAPWAE